MIASPACGLRPGMRARYRPRCYVTSRISADKSARHHARRTYNLEEKHDDLAFLPGGRAPRGSRCDQPCGGDRGRKLWCVGQRHAVRRRPGEGLLQG